MTTRWFRGGDREPGVRRDHGFDAAAEGARYELTAPIAEQIWRRICSEETNESGVLDEDRAQQRFHDVALRVQRRGGRLVPDPGKTTQVEAEMSGAASAASVFAAPVPGRTTLVEQMARQAEAQQRGSRAPGDAAPPVREPRAQGAGRSPQEPTGPISGPDPELRGNAVAPARELPAQDEVRALLARLSGHPSPEGGAFARPDELPAHAEPLARPSGSSAPEDRAHPHELPGQAEMLARPSGNSAPEDCPVARPHELPARPSGGVARQTAHEHGPHDQAPSALRAPRGPEAAGRGATGLLEARLRATFGLRERDVAIERESARPRGAEGVTVDQTVHLGRGQFDLESEEGRVRLGHEVAHAVQQQQGDGRAQISQRERSELEAEAELAGHAFARGEAFQVRGRAPAAVSLFRGAQPPVYEPLAPPDPELLDTADEPAPAIAPAGPDRAEPHAAAHAADASSGGTASAQGAAPAPHAAGDVATADHAATDRANAIGPTGAATADLESPMARETGAATRHATATDHAPPAAGGAHAGALPRGTTTDRPEPSGHAGAAANASEPRPPEGSATVVSVGVEGKPPIQSSPVRGLPFGAIAKQVKQAAAGGLRIAVPARRVPTSPAEPAPIEAASIEVAEPAAAPAPMPSVATRAPAAAPAIRFAPGAEAEHPGAADAQANAYVRASQDRMASLRDYVDQTARALEPRLTTAAEAIDAAKRKNQTAIRGAMARLRHQAAARVQAARVDIGQQHDLTVAAIQRAGVAAQAQLDTQTQAALQAVAAAEAACVPKLDAAYVAGDQRFRQSGATVGAEAIAIGARFRGQWMSQLDGESTIMSGPVHDNRLKARAKAADQVAEAYRQQLTDAANQQAAAAVQGKARDRESLAACGTAHRDAILRTQRDACAGIAQAETSATAAADKQRDTDLRTLTTQHRSTLNQIARKEAALIKELGKFAHAHQAAVRGFVHAAVTRCLGGVDELVGQHDTAMGDLRDKAAATAAPAAGDLAPQLQQQQGDLQQSAGATESRFRDVFAGAEHQIAVTQGQSVQGLDGFGEAVRQTTSQIAASIVHTVANLATHSHKGFTAIEHQHAASIQTTAGAALTANQGVAASSTTAFGHLIDNLGAGFETSAQALETSLRKPLAGLEPQITDAADAAAKQVQPRWKKVLKVLVMVAVIVVVAVVAGPAVIGAIGAMAGGLGASAAVAGAIGVVVGGAAVGAASGAVLQISNNVIDGNKWHEGVGTAMAVGAISGVFGGVGGLAAKGIASVGIRLAVTLGFDGAGSVVGNLATGQPITFEGIVMGLAIGLGMSVGMGALGKFGGRFGKKVEAIQSRAHEAGEAFGDRAAAAVKGGGAAAVGPAKPVAVEPATAKPTIDEPAVARPAAADRAPVEEGSALAKQGRKATVEQAHEALAKLKLSPEHTLTVRNAKYQLTDLVDIGEGRLAAVAIVEVDGVATVQVFYRSNSQAGWRLLPATNEGVYGQPGYDKAGAEHILDLPSSVQAKLSNLAEAGNVRTDLHGDAVEGLVNKVVPRNRSIEEHDAYKHSSDYAGKQVKQVVLADPATGRISAGKRPDFTKPVSQYKSKSAAAGEVDALVYESADGTLEYTVFKDADNHIWIGSVTSKEAKITPLGVASEAVTLPKENLVPLWEYHQQIPGGSRGVTNPRRSEYGSAWDFLKQQPDIKAWYKATGTPMPDTHVVGSGGSSKQRGAVEGEPPRAPFAKSPPA